MECMKIHRNSYDRYSSLPNMDMWVVYSIFKHFGRNTREAVGYSFSSAYFHTIIDFNIHTSHTLIRHRHTLRIDLSGEWVVNCECLMCIVHCYRCRCMSISFAFFCLHFELISAISSAKQQKSSKFAGDTRIFWFVNRIKWKQRIFLVLFLSWPKIILIRIAIEQVTHKTHCSCLTKMPADINQWMRIWKWKQMILLTPETETKNTNKEKKSI